MTMERAERETTTADLAGRNDDRDEAVRDRDEAHDRDRATEGREDVDHEERDRHADEPLLPAEDTEHYMSRWKSIQASFVDEPRSSLKEADALVAETMQRLAEGFAEERDKLEGHWDRGDDVSTEELRVTLQRYRSFFERLLAA
jgi:hypothetical protein